jgi:hypothetical protein
MFVHSSKALSLGSDTVIQLCRNLSTFHPNEERLSKVFAAAIEKVTDYLAEIEIVSRKLRGDQRFWLLL